jgi:hypothetical protein
MLNAAIDQALAILSIPAVGAPASRRGVKRLVFAHIGRPTLRALARGVTPPFGEIAADGQVFVIRRMGVWPEPSWHRGCRGQEAPCSATRHS